MYSSLAYLMGSTVSGRMKRMWGGKCCKKTSVYLNHHKIFTHPRVKIMEMQSFNKISQTEKERVAY